MPYHSCLYHCRVRHRRYTPIEHGFNYPLPVWWIDLDEMEQLENDFSLLGKRWFYPFRLLRDDYFGDPAIPLKQAIGDLVHEKQGFRPDGPIRMLTQLRTLGMSFNPVSFYYCYDKPGERVRAIVAEITNTPWLERFQYVMSPGEGANGYSGRSHSFTFDKQFHVSPFHPMDMRYRWLFREPSEQLSIHMQNYRQGELVFDATQVGQRVPITSRSLMSLCAKSPLIPLTVVGGIYWNALKLKLKGAPFYDNPTTSPGSVAGASSGAKQAPLSSFGVVNHES